MLPREALFIKGPVRLTPSQTKIVDYLLHNPDQSAFLSAAKLGQRLGLSDATIVRLAQALGFSGYGQLRKHLRDHLMARLDTVSRLQGTTGRVTSVEGVLRSVLQADLANLKALAANISAGSFEQFVQTLTPRREVHIVGLRSAHSLALFLTSALRYLGRRVHPIVPGVGDLWADLGSVDPEAVLVALSFPRYTRQTIEVAEHFHAAGATILAITDSALSPLSPLARTALYCPFRIESHMESFVAAFSLLNAVITAVAFLEGKACLEGLGRMERLWEKQGVYYQVQGRGV